MKKKYFKLILAIVFIVLYFVTSVEAEERLHWYIQQGKGRPLCESLTRITNNNPPLEVIIPNIPWKQVLAIEGVREPEWRELDPQKYEDFFLKARKFKAEQGGLDETTISFTRWFLPPKERWVDESVRKKPISDEEALKIYRDFIRRGGKMKVFRYDISDTKQPILRDFVQYESPEKDFSDWDGYTLQAEPGLTGIPWAGVPLSELGQGYRLLIYKNGLFSFVGFRRGDDEYRVTQMGGDRDVNFSDNSPYSLDSFLCKIDFGNVLGTPYLIAIQGIIKYGVPRTPYLNGTGNDLPNVIKGNTGNNKLDGGGDNDTLDGGRRKIFNITILTKTFHFKKLQGLATANIRRVA